MAQGERISTKSKKPNKLSAQRPSPYKSFVGEPHPATYISLARAMSLRQPQLQGILENQAFPFFLTGHGGELNKMGSAVGENWVEWILVGHLAVSAPRGDAERKSS